MQPDRADTAQGNSRRFAMSLSGIVMGWLILLAMAVVYEYGGEWQATNAQLMALAVVVVLNIVCIQKLVDLAADRMRRHRDGH